MRDVLADEIQPGLVLHLDPATLIAAGATASCPADKRVVGGHFFVCVTTAKDGSSTWIPTYSNRAIGNVEIPSAAKSGHIKWTGTPSYYSPHQVWTVPTAAAVADAARVGRDASRQRQRNSAKIYS